MHHSFTLRLTGFCLGAASSMLWQSLPNLPALICWCVLLLAFQSLYRLRYPFLPCSRRKSSHSATLPGIGKLIQGASFGILWMASVGHWYVVWQLPDGNIPQDVTVFGQIIDVDCDHASQRLTVAMTSLNETRYWLKRHIRVYEHKPDACRSPGQTVRFIARLKPASGLANPGALDYQRVLVSKGIHATGYLKSWVTWQPQDVSLRQVIKQFVIDNSLTDPRWLLALLLGDRSGLTQSDWDSLQKTGTAHIFSVSGMHVGIIAAALLIFVKSTLMAAFRAYGTQAPHYNIRRVVAVAVCIAAFAYVSLTGAALPAVRAWVLLLVCFVMNTSRSYWSARHVALLMTTMCLLLFPLQLLSPGFMLSVCAVYGIWFLLWRFRLSSLTGWQAVFFLQIGLSLLLLPLTLGWFSLASWTSLPVNLVLIPIVTLVLPLLFILLGVAILLPVQATFLISYCSAFMNTIAHGLATIAGLSSGTADLELPAGPLLMLLLAILLAAMPYIPFRKTCVALCLMPLLLSGLPYNQNRWYLHVFDVGQGTAMAISRGERAVIIDTGPAFNGEAYAMKNAVIPALTRFNIRYIDGVIISHSDIDHAGGVSFLRQHPLTHAKTFWHSPTSGCRQGEQFEWQSLTFDYLWPEHGNKADNNANSCVVFVTGGKHRILLPGDIERTTEYKLLVQETSLKTDILIAPHHGSETSSTTAWVNATQPDTVIYNTGFLNRWQFPSERVKTRYRQAKVKQVETAKSGYVRVALAERSPPEIVRYRQDLAPAWYHANLFINDDP